MKSDAERIIADYLNEKNIRYVYEGRVRGVGKPDFYLPDHDVYVEYWGLIDAKDKAIREKYIKSMKWKMAQYHNKNVKFISIYPNNLDNLDRIFRSKFKKITGYALTIPE